MDKFSRLSFKLDGLHSLRFFYSFQARKALAVGYSKEYARLSYKVADTDAAIARLEAKIASTKPPMPRRRKASPTIH
ncbi:hypothetical protein FY137_06075 [Agrobacterium tumefaciens]|nr:hypothetical protein FY137_06075 [Agrobacterium tumefaciens]